MPRSPDGPRLVVAPHPCTFERFDRLVPEGWTVARALEELGLAEAPTVHVHVDGEPVPRERWAETTLKHGQLVTVRVVPQGGGDGRKVANTVLTLAVIAVAAATGTWVAGLAGGGVLGAAAGAVTTAAVGYAGMLGVNALAPLPRAGVSGGRPGAPERLPSLLGGRNALRRYEPIPRIYGRRRIYPAHGALPYTEIVGSDQYLVQAFCLGYGPLQITDLKIGDTPIDQFQGVEYEILQGYDTDPALTLYTADVYEEAPGVTLTEGAAATVRTTQAGAEEISLDITFPAGLIWYEDNGDKHSIQATFQIEYAAAGSGQWQTPTFLRKTDGLTEPAAGQIAIEATRAETLRLGVSFRPPSPGQYDVRVQFVSASRHSTSDDQAIGVDVAGTEPVWTALRSIKAVNPVQKPGLAWVALRIKATDQLQGIVDRFNCVVTSILPVWDGVQWTEQATRNPAWAYCDVLRGKANRRPVADSRLDLAALKSWADLCDQKGWSLDAEIEQDTTVWQLLHDICAVGRAAFVMRDGKYSVAPDVEQTTPVQHFSPRNSWGWRTTRAFPDPPHALRVRFIDSTTWQQAERVVYADGYDETTASVYDEIELWGVTDADQAWSMGRYFLAVGKLRPETHELWVDVEHLVCQVGDLVRVTHDVPLWGVMAARIKAVTTDGQGQVTSVTLDELVPMEAGKTYAARVRLEDLTSVVQTMQTVAGETDTLTFTAPVSGPKVGDLVLFGESGTESVECLVKAIEPGPELTARLTLVEHAPAVYQADQGTIPPWDPKITHPADVTQTAPAAPQVIAAQAEAHVHDRTTGQLDPRIVVTVAPPGGYSDPVTHLEAQYRLAPPGETPGPWLAAGMTPAGSGMAVVSPVTAGATYEVRVRWVTRLGQTSAWTQTSTLTVQKDLTPPATPTGLAGSFADTVVWTWDPAPEADFSHFEVSLDGGTTWTRVDATRYEIAAPTGRSYTLQVRAVDRTGNASPAASSAVSLTTPAAPSTGYLKTQVRDNVLQVWVDSAFPESPGHRGFTFEWRKVGDATWTAIDGAVATIVVPLTDFSGDTQDVEIRYAEVDVLGQGTMSSSVTVTLTRPSYDDLIQVPPLAQSLWVPSDGELFAFAKNVTGSKGTAPL
ncbi:host specificity factor TipJ family phage tail protein [Deferrisoma camini]|uniref:host specificity factor TipJ family phage tail protein n=1 Tax=Deferrisoma camini TaxID=1035120 RepID=UPI00046D7202|nr:host specificity factor TipJ family phage tail protein [Deferrisoma camini]